MWAAFNLLLSHYFITFMQADLRFTTHQCKRRRCYRSRGFKPQHPQGTACVQGSSKASVHRSNSEHFKLITNISFSWARTCPSSAFNIWDPTTVLTFRSTILGFLRWGGPKPSSWASPPSHPKQEFPGISLSAPTCFDFRTNSAWPAAAIFTHLASRTSPPTLNDFTGDNSICPTAAILTSLASGTSLKESFAFPLLNLVRVGA